MTRTTVVAALMLAMAAGASADKVANCANPASSMFEAVECEGRRNPPPDGAQAAPEVWNAYMSVRFELAIKVDAGEMTLVEFREFDAAALDVTMQLLHAAHLGRLEERKVRAAERAAAAAELAARVEVHKLCIRMTGRPCTR